jgi:hypothetical protein
MARIKDRDSPFLFDLRRRFGWARLRVSVGEERLPQISKWATEACFHAASMVLVQPDPLPAWSNREMNRVTFVRKRFQLWICAAFGLDV